MPFEVIEDGQGIVVRLTGQIDRADWDGVGSAVEQAFDREGGWAAIDLSKTTFMNSSGLGSLIQIVSKGRLRGGSSVLINPSPFVRGVLEVTRLDQWFDIFPDLLRAKERMLSR